MPARGSRLRQLWLLGLPAPKAIPGRRLSTKWQEADGRWSSGSRPVCACMLSSSSVGGLFTASVVSALPMHVPVEALSSAKPADAWVSPTLRGQRGSFRHLWQNEAGTKSW